MRRGARACLKHIAFSAQREGESELCCVSSTLGRELHRLCEKAHFIALYLEHHAASVLRGVFLVTDTSTSLLLIHPHDDVIMAWTV